MRIDHRVLLFTYTEEPGKSEADGSDIPGAAYRLLSGRIWADRHKRLQHGVFSHGGSARV
jgi:hypothetical protein